ncbi:MAG TPA: NAD-dependent epimerase/dehydratase family protein [Acidimicrobiales bacterium]|nr:NAD-dependent epimerase/dehydratase family protein [Acidimicrobiales bacterium]
MRAVVTGGCGFIGSHVVGRLLSAGHDVVVVDRHLSAVWPDADYLRIDILDLASLSEAVSDADVVFHLAAVADVDKALQAPVDTAQINLTGTANILEASRQAGVGRFVLASTVWVYGAAPGDGGISEDSPLDPMAVNHVYTASKIGAEMLVRSYQALYGLDYTILRYGIPYGPGMRDELVIARFVRQALAGQPLTIAGDGSQYRYYVYVEDLADAHVRVLTPGAANQVVALDGTEQVSIRHIAESVQEVIGDVEVTYQPARAGDFAGRQVDARRAAEVLGWAPETPFKEGLRRYVDWYRRSASRHPAGPPA